MFSGQELGEWYHLTAMLSGRQLDSTVSILTGSTSTYKLGVLPSCHANAMNLAVQIAPQYAVSGCDAFDANVYLRRPSFDEATMTSCLRNMKRNKDL